MHEFLDTRQLIAFNTLTQTGNFTHAAQKLNLTQSAISHSIRNLEDQLACKLVHRIGKKVVITPEGELLQPYAQRILNLMSEAKSHLSDRLGWGQSRLRIGASTTICEHFLPVILREFNECFPQCSLTIVPADTPRQLELIRSGEIDMGIIIESDEMDSLELRPLFRDELKLITSPIHPWAKQGRLDTAAWQDQRLILYNKTSQTYKLINTYLKDRQLDLTHSIELASMEAIKQLVKTNFGVSILADWIVESEVNLRSLVSFGLGRKKLRRQWSVAFLKGKNLSITEETFLGLATSLSETKFSH